MSQSRQTNKSANRSRTYAPAPERLADLGAKTLQDARRDVAEAAGQTIAQYRSAD
jgi:hypothetical protein